MAGLTPYTFAQFQQLQQTAFAASLDPKYGSANLGQGGPIGAQLNANAQLGYILQGQIATVGNFDRLTSCTGQDIDSFIAPFGYTRILGSYATDASGVMTSPSPVSGTPFILPIGQIIRTASGTQYVVITPTGANTAGYNANAGGYPSGGYVIPVGASSVNYSQQCLTLGTGGNTGAGTVTQLYSGLGAQTAPGLQNCTFTNTQAITNAVDSEDDATLIARFQTQGGFPKVGVRYAILGAIQGVQPGLTYQMGDHINADGSYHSAYFTLIVNNANSGSSPSPQLLQNVYNAVDKVRAGGIEFQVVGPSLIPVSITATVVPTASYSPTYLQETVSTSLSQFANSQNLNADGTPTTLSYASILAYILSITGVATVHAGVLVNGAATDLSAGFGYQFSAGTMTITTASS